MYDPPELRSAVDAWWAGIARALCAEGICGVPDRLDRETAFDQLWRSPDLLVAQACGYPMMIGWSDVLLYVATPRYSASGCDGSSYCSWLIVAADSRFECVEDLRGARCSINGRNSHSGFNALRAHVAPHSVAGRFFGSVHVSGGHSESLAQLLAGEVDVAALDCVTYALLQRCRGDAIAATRIIDRTESAPGLPYVTRKNIDGDIQNRLRAGLVAAFTDPTLADVRSELLIEGLEFLPVQRYEKMVDMQSAAFTRGYRELG